MPTYDQHTYNIYLTISHFGHYSFCVTRSASDKLRNSSAECASEPLSSSANNEPHSLTAGAGISDVNDQVHVPALDVPGNGREADKSDEDSQRALHQQVQPIGQYEAEEKAQREWEEKYRESNSCTPVYLLIHLLFILHNSCIDCSK